MSKVIDIHPDDAVNGYALSQPDCVYRLLGEVVLTFEEPIPEVSSPVGAFAGFIFRASGVTLDLNGYGVFMSDLAARRHRFVSCVSLSPSPFLTGEGPSSFPDMFTLNDIKVTNGSIGRASHFCVHGLLAKSVRLTRLVLGDYEVGAISIGGMEDVLIQDCEVRSGAHAVPSFEASQVAGLTNLLALVAPYSNLVTRAHEFVDSNIVELPQGSGAFGVAITGSAGARGAITQNPEPSDYPLSKNVTLERVSVSSVALEIKRAQLANPSFACPKKTYGSSLAAIGPMNDTVPVSGAPGIRGELHRAIEHSTSPLLADANARVIPPLCCPVSRPRVVFEGGAAQNCCRANPRDLLPLRVMGDNHDSMGHVTKGVFGIFAEHVDELKLIDVSVEPPILVEPNRPRSVRAALSIEVFVNGAFEAIRSPSPVTFADLSPAPVVSPVSPSCCPGEIPRAVNGAPLDLFGQYGAKKTRVGIIPGGALVPLGCLPDCCGIGARVSAKGSLVAYEPHVNCTYCA